jgi:hypothetical protein
LLDNIFFAVWELLIKKICKMMKQFITLLAVLFSATVFAQNVGIGTTTPDANAQLDVSSINKGILIPRMTLAQRNTIPGIAQGLLIYQTDNNTGFYVNKSSSFAFNWVPITEGKNLWTTSLGNSNYISNINTGNVGIGTTLPEMKFAVTNDDSAIVLFNNSQTLANNIQSNIYVGTGRNGFGGYFTGGIRTTGTSASTARMSLLTGATTVGSNLQERVSIDNAGNMGVGTITPNYILDVNGRMRLRDKGSSLTAGIWHNKADNSEAAFIGMVNDSTYGFFGNGTSGNWKIGFDIKNAQMGIGLTDPTAPLSFASNIGNKIALWGDATGGHYGLGIQGSLLQMYSSASNADIAFGYGSSASFTEQMRIKGTGNVGIGNNAPSNKLDVSGRMRLRNESAGVSAGIWIDGTTTAQRGFIGAYDNNYMGFYGSGNTNWGLLYNENTGQVNIGTATPATGYLLNVNGKIISEEVRVQLKAAWPDYVFEQDYKKLSLNELEKYVDENKHLPNIPSAAEVEKDGQHLGEIQRKMLEKIEELSLYILELNKKIKILEEKNNSTEIKK